MRISGWSSDVCSSDLACPADDGLHLLHVRRQRDRQRRRRPAAGPVAAVVLEFRRIGFQAPAGDVVAQIVEARVGHGWVNREYVARKGSRRDRIVIPAKAGMRSEEHTSELQSRMRQSYDVFCLEK